MASEPDRRLSGSCMKSSRFCRRIFPSPLQEAPPADLIEAWPGVNFVGKVPDATAFVEAGALIPLISRAGTGVQLKTIETFELGMPSVATSHSVRGISQVPANCTIANNPSDFAAAVIKQLEKIRTGIARNSMARFSHARR